MNDSGEFSGSISRAMNPKDRFLSLKVWVVDIVSLQSERSPEKILGRSSTLVIQWFEGSDERSVF